MTNFEFHSILNRILLTLASIPMVLILYLALTIVFSLILQIPGGLSVSTLMPNNIFIGITFAAFFLMVMGFGVTLYFIWKGFWRAAFVYLAIFFIAAVIGYANQYRSLRVFDIFYVGLNTLSLIAVFSIGFGVKVFSRKIWTILFWICLVVFPLVAFMRFFPQFSYLIPDTLLGRLHIKSSNLLVFESGRVINLIFQAFFLYAIYKLGYGKKNVTSKPDSVMC